MQSGNEKTEDAKIFVRSSSELFNLSNPLAKGVNLFDIAHSLSRVQRFTGHLDHDETPDFTYSVGQHSIMVSRLVSPEFALEGLLHDGAEAYVNDLSTPLKNKVGAAYKDIENGIHAAIAERFSIPTIMSPEVKVADRVALNAESSSLFPDDERLNQSNVNFAWMEIKPMRPDEVRRAFLERFIELAGIEAYRVQLTSYNPVIPDSIELAHKYLRKSGLPKEMIDRRMKDLRNVMVETSRHSASPTTIAASILVAAAMHTHIPVSEIIASTNGKTASTFESVRLAIINGAQDVPAKRQERIILSAIEHLGLKRDANASVTKPLVMSDVVGHVMIDHSCLSRAVQPCQNQ